MMLQSWLSCMVTPSRYDRPWTDVDKQSRVDYWQTHDEDISKLGCA